MARDETIRVPVTAAEKRKIERLAKQAGRPVADYLRRLALGEEVAPDGRVRVADE